MTKWADFLISAVKYDSSHHIDQARQHKDKEGSIDNGILVDRLTIANNIKGGKSYMTIYSGRSTWKKGEQLKTFRIGGDYFIRADDNKVLFDNLGPLTELE